jgi:exopolysaccharide production protein ExoQ
MSIRGRLTYMLKPAPIRTKSYAKAASKFPGSLISVFFLIGLLFVMGGFVLQLSGVSDPDALPTTEAIATGSLLSQSILGIFYIGGLAILLGTDIGIRMLGRAWPVLLLSGLALISTTWSAWPWLTLRHAFALFGTLTFGLSLVAAFDYQSCLRILIRTLTISIVLSIIWVLVLPTYAIHHATDISQVVHFGKWRGIFAHKNFLGGEVAGFTFALLAVFGHYGFKNLLVRIGAMTATVVCLVAANSSTGYAIAFVVTVFGLSLSFVAVQPTEYRLSSLIIVLGSMLLLSVFTGGIMDIALKILGKDPDLTGRTEYWANVLPLMHGYWTLGYGYYAGGLAISDAIADLTHQDRLGSTHNGYLDMLVSFGIVGSIVVFGVLLWFVLKSLSFLLTGRANLRALRTFPLFVAVYVLVHNLVESSLLAANTLVPLMLSIAAGMLVRESITASAHAQPRKASDGAPIQGHNRR